MLKAFLLVGAGGAAGSIGRYAAGLIGANKSFPLNTLVINVAGSLVIGIVLAYAMEKGESANNWKLLLATGLCGGFTTFSTFSFENLRLLQQGKWQLCLAYCFSSVLLGITATWIGFKLYH